MTLLHADQARVEWSAEKKQWHVVITVGGEVIKRWLPKQPHESSDDALRVIAVETAKDEGYELDPGRVEVSR
jgi:hypothetical protein